MSSVWEPILHKLVERDFIIATTTEQSIPEFFRVCVHTHSTSVPVPHWMVLNRASPFLPTDGRLFCQPKSIKTWAIHVHIINGFCYYVLEMSIVFIVFQYWLFERFEFSIFQFFRFSHSLVNKTVLRRRYVFSLFPLLSYYYMFLILSLSHKITNFEFLEFCV